MKCLRCNNEFSMDKGVCCNKTSPFYSLDNCYTCQEYPTIEKLNTHLV